MACTKDVFIDFLIKPADKIRNKTVQEKDCSNLLVGLNDLLQVRDF